MPRAKKSPMCMVCHLPLSLGMNNLVECARGTYICRECADAAILCFDSKETYTPPAKGQSNAVPLLTPREIAEELDKRIIGQDSAKRALAVAAWKHMQRQRGNTAVPPAHVLLYGPTGCGKTYLAKTLARLMDVPFISVDATTFSETGYRGRDVHDIIFDILEKAETRRKAQNAVIFVDEFDKLAALGGSERQAYQRGTQHGFLTILEGGEVSAERRYDTATLDVSGLLFIFAGAFPALSDVITARTRDNKAHHMGFGCTLKSTEKLDVGVLLAQAIPEDFVQYGIEAELVGRIPVLAPVMPLGITDLTHILTEADGSVAAQYTSFFEHLGKHFTLAPNAAEELAHIAHKSGTGARALRGKLERIIADLLFELPADSDITITRDMIMEANLS